MSNDKYNVLFVCLGNICRSPMAEAVFAHEVNKRGLREKFGIIDSAGTGAYHVGDDPDDRTVAQCRRHGIPITSTARRVCQDDFDEFTHILAMDKDNLMMLQRYCPNRPSQAEVRLFGSYDDGKAIADPYYGGKGGFERTYEQCLRYTDKFLQELFPESSSNN